LKIKVAVGADCILEEIIDEGPASRSVSRFSHLASAEVNRILQLGQTALVLSRIKLPACKKARHHMEDYSANLLEELEQQLGNIATKCLSIEVSYYNSLFPAHRGMAIDDGLSYYATKLCTKADAVIARHTENSTWTRVESTRPDLGSSRLARLINEHYNISKAKDIMKRIASTQEMSGRRSLLQHRGIEIGRTWNNSSDTIVPHKQARSQSDIVFPTYENENMIVSGLEPLIDLTSQISAEVEANDQADIHKGLDKAGEIDPARKIWNEMRRSSRGPQQRPSLLLSRERNREASHSSHETSVFKLSSNNSAIDMCDNDDEFGGRSMMQEIKEIALRNKRSIGADTLKSMAPLGTPKQMGMGTARGVWPFGWFMGN
jgi:hypothetical protein